MTLGYQCLTTKVSAVTEAHGRGNPREIFDRHWEFLAIRPPADARRCYLAALGVAEDSDSDSGVRIADSQQSNRNVFLSRIAKQWCSID